MTRISFLLLFIFSGILLLAQQKVVPDSVIVKLPVKTRPYLELKAYGGVENSDLSFSDVFGFLNQGFLSNAVKEDFLNSINGNIRFGYQTGFSVGFYQPGYEVFDIYKKGNSIFFENRYLSGGRLNNDLTALALFGNKRFAGETINLGPSAYESWFYTTLNYGFDLLLDSISPLHLVAGLVLGHNYSFYDIDKGDLFTQPEGEYLDLDLEYRFRSTDNSDNRLKLQGLGITTSGQPEFKLSDRYSLEATVKDLGFVSWLDVQVVDVDSSFRFEGVEFDNIFDINDSIVSLEEARYEESFYSNETRTHFALLPFTVQARLKRKLHSSLLSNVYGYARYLYLAGYIPRIGFGSEFILSKRHLFDTDLSYGGFNQLTLGLDYRWKIDNMWELAAGINNLAIVIPSLGLGTTAYISMRYIL